MDCFELIVCFLIITLLRLRAMQPNRLPLQSNKISPFANYLDSFLEKVANALLFWVPDGAHNDTRKDE